MLKPDKVWLGDATSVRVSTTDSLITFRDENDGELVFVRKEHVDDLIVYLTYYKQWWEEKHAE